MLGKNRALSAGGGLYRTHESGSDNVPARGRPAKKSGTGEPRLSGSPGILTILLHAEYRLARVPNRLQSL
jgi:hypothetical protein